MRDGTGGQRLAFANFPVSAVLSLSIDGLRDTAGAGATAALAPGMSSSPTELALRGYVFTRRAQNVDRHLHRRLCGDAARLAQACIELVCQRYRERTRIGEVSKALGGGETVTYSQKDMSDDIKTLLSQYRAVAPVSGFVRRAGADRDRSGDVGGGAVITAEIGRRRRAGRTARRDAAGARRRVGGGGRAAG